MAERDGRVRRDRNDRTALVPAGVLPDWSGPRRSSGGSIRVDAVVPAAPQLPGDRLPGDSLSVPFPLPGDWPRYTRVHLRTCGAWTVFTRTGHLSLRREPA